LTLNAGQRTTETLSERASHPVQPCLYDDRPHASKFGIVGGAHVERHEQVGRAQEVDHGRDVIASFLKTRCFPVIVGEGGIVERQESLDVVGIVLNKANEDPVLARRCYRDGERQITYARMIAKEVRSLGMPSSVWGHRWR
jgi:hypothetical protein